jgi:hypothetical protein
MPGRFWSHARPDKLAGLQEEAMPEIVRFLQINTIQYPQKRKKYNAKKERNYRTVTSCLLSLEGWRLLLNFLMEFEEQIYRESRYR